MPTLGKQEGAVVSTGDEAGVLSDHHNGTSQAPRGKSLVVGTPGEQHRDEPYVSGLRQPAALLYGDPAGMTATDFVDFFRRLTHNQDRPSFLVVDHDFSHDAPMATAPSRSTEDQLRLFHQPAYSLELNPDEWGWPHGKGRRVGRRVVTGPPQFRDLVLSSLPRLQKLPDSIRGFFYAPNLRYMIGYVS